MTETQELVHANCPEKRDIRPPAFRLTKTTQSSKMEFWECQGCGAEVIRTVAERDTSPAEPTKGQQE